MRFSVIIPYHNRIGEDRSWMLDQLWESLPDRDDLEAIFVDDHSSIEWRPSHTKAKTTLKLLKNHENRRFAGTARNTGLENAEGAFVFFADSDDYFTQELDAILDGVSDEDGVVVFYAESVDEAGNPGVRHHGINVKVDTVLDDPDGLGLCRLHVPTCKIINRSIIDAHHLRFSDSLAANDGVFSVRLGLSHPDVRVENLPGYVFRQGNVSLTSRKSPAIVKARLRIAREVVGLYRQAGYPHRGFQILRLYAASWRQSPRAVIVDALTMPTRPREFLRTLRYIAGHTRRKVFG